MKLAITTVIQSAHITDILVIVIF